MRDVGTGQSLQDLLQRVSIHLDGLAAEVHAIEHAIGKELGDDISLKGDYIKRLQRLDYLRQSLEDLALLQLFVSENCNSMIEANFMDRLKLASTKELVATGKSQPVRTVGDTSMGDVDLF